MTQRLVLLHGFTQRGESWKPIVDVLRKRLGSAWEFITPDLPGHGNEPIGADCDLRSAALVFGDRYGPAHWVGYSLGARVLLHLVLEVPEVVESLTLVGAKAGFEDRNVAAERVEADNALADRIEAFDAAELRTWLEQEWLTLPLFSRLPADRRGLDIRSTNDPKSLADSLRFHGSGVQQYVISGLATVGVKTSIVRGEFDSPLVVDDGVKIAAVMPNATAHVVPDVGHSVPWEATETFAEIVVRTIGAVDDLDC